MFMVGAAGVETLIVGGAAGGFCCVAEVTVKLDLFKADRPVNFFPFTTVEPEVDDDPTVAVPFQSLLHTKIK